MDVLSLCRLPVGIVRWQSPAPALTLIVKATFTLERDGYAVLAAEQQPLSLDRPGVDTGPNELFVATDFVPFKPRGEVLLAGHAHAPAPAWAIAARLRVNAFDKPFVAYSDKPAASIPLTDAYLRSGPSPQAGFVRVSARAPWSPERAVFPGARLIAPSGVPVAPLPQGFDYRIFQAAPQDQQLEMPLFTAFVVLEGLLPGAPLRRVQLPGLCPRGFLLSGPPDPRGAPSAEAPLRADTLWIDTDRAQCTLSFRGVFELVKELSQLVVVLGQPGAVQSWPSICGDLRRAVHTHAVEAWELARPPAVPGSAARSAPWPPALEPEWAEQRVSWTPDATTAPVASKSPLPFVRPPPPAKAEHRPPRGPRGTDVPPAPAARRTELGLSAKQSPPAAAIEDEPAWASGTVGLKPGQLFAPAVPFKKDRRADPGALGVRPPRGPHGTEFPPAPEAQADSPAPEDVQEGLPAPDVEEEPEWSASTIGLSPGQLFAPAVPFKQPPVPAIAVLPQARSDGTAEAFAQPSGEDEEPATERLQRLLHGIPAVPVPAVEEEPDWATGTAALKDGHVFAAAMPFGMAVGSAQASAPVQQPPEVESLPAPPQIEEPPLLPVEKYAAIKAAIWTAGTARDELLQQHGLTEIDWEIAEQRQLEVLEREAAEGKAVVVLALLSALDERVPQVFANCRPVDQ